MQMKRHPRAEKLNVKAYRKPKNYIRPVGVNWKTFEKILENIRKTFEDL